MTDELPILAAKRDTLSELEELRKVVEELQEQLEALSKPPYGYATIAAVKDKDKMITILSGGSFTDMEAPPKLKLKPGDTVLTYGLGQPKEVVPPITVGPVSTVIEVIDAVYAEVAGSNGAQRVLRGSIEKLEEGDLVSLDSSSKCIVAKHPLKKPLFVPEIVENITWNDIGGQEDAKREMIEAIELPHRNPEIFKYYNKKPTKGVLLSGPPGCGKTMLGKATANSLAKRGQKAGFIYVKGPEVLDPYVGVAEATVRSLFQRARAHKAKNGASAVIFIDEADAILGVRGGYHSFMEKTIVPTFLAEMDGVEESGAVVILATNRPDTLDPAIVRDGRIDRKVKVTRPTQKDSESIFSIYLKKIPIYRDEQVKEMAKMAAQELFSMDRLLYHLYFEDETCEKVALADFVSGAMIAGVVDKAVSIAIHRDLETNRKIGVTRQNLLDAVHQTFLQHRDTNHDEVILDRVNGRAFHLQKVAA